MKNDFLQGSDKLKAEIISTGTELLLGKTLNTSAFYLTGQLSGMGLEVDYHTTVGDNRERLLGAVRTALNRSAIVFITGGLGPTADDLTKEIVAEVLGLDMNIDVNSLERVINYYVNETGLPPGSEKQAVFPKGAKVLPNMAGTAPGALIKNKDKYCIILPGPPTEMRTMFELYVLPELQNNVLNNQERLHVRSLKVFGFGESELEQELQGLTGQQSPFLTLLDKHTYMEVRIGLTARKQEQAQELLNRTETEIRRRVGDQVFAVNEETHSQVIGTLLRRHNLTLATAESCTGGLLGGIITAEAGSSDYYLGGAVSYSNQVKESLLGVNFKSLRKYGAVSKEVAGEMSIGAIRCFQADMALAVTGVAGPGGGTEDKPVGLVFIALADSRGIINIKKCLFTGNRESIRNMSVETALDILRKHLLKL